MNTLYILILLGIIVFIIIIITIHNQKNDRIGIVSMMKQPHQVLTWINYHLKIGADKLYIFIDDPNDPAINIINDHINKNDYNDKIMITIITEQWKKDNSCEDDNDKDKPQNWNVRQDRCVDNALKYAQNDKIDIIIHIDSDELLYSQNKKKLNEIFNQYKNYNTFGIINYEMVPDKDDYINCFLENKQFRTGGKNYIAYGNGKSAGRVGFTRSNGPHEIILMSGYNNKKIITENDLVVLHYVSCNLDETIKKYKTYGDFKDDRWEWATLHLEARDTMKLCDSDCSDRAKDIFKKRMKKDDDKIINIDISETLK